jgi:hypothetical protein
MSAVEIREKLLKAYRYPEKKFCFFTGQNDSRLCEALGKKQWDWTPQKTINIEPYYWNTHTIPLTFGCRKVETSEGKEWISPMIGDPSQVFDINIPDIYDGRTGEILRLAEKIMKNSPQDSLIRLPDVQSPLGVCELMWDQSFYMCLLTNLDEIKVLLDKVTEFIIAYIREFQSILGKRYNPACHPHLWSDPEGYYISDDVNSMVSPEMHSELSVEYINRITDELGPVFYHTCTLTEPYLDNIKKVKNIKALNWSTGTSMDPAKIIKQFSGKVLLAPHLGLNIHTEGGIINLDHEFRDEIDVFKYYLDNMTDSTTLNIVIHESLFDEIEKVLEIYKLLYDYGYTPEQNLSF